MVRSFFKNFMLSRFHKLLFCISLMIIGYYLYQNIFVYTVNEGALFLFDSNLSFLVFTNVFYIFLVYRYYVYSKMRSFSTVRIGNQKFCLFVAKNEILLWLFFTVPIYIICPLCIGVSRPFVNLYSIHLAFYIFLSFVLIFFQVSWFYAKLPIHINLIISYIVMAIYNYYLCDMITRLFS